MSASEVVLIHVRSRRPSEARAYQELLDLLNQAALTAIAGTGATVTLLAAAEEPEQMVREAARAAEVVVILGGEDVDPSLYGQADARPVRSRYETRADRAQLAVIHDAIRDGRPLVGICRGHQLLNVALGGTLRQHMVGHHRDGADPFVPTRVTEAGTATSRTVLCTHHQAVDRLGEGLRVTHRADDGTVEAVVLDGSPIVGVQWHPEHPLVAAEQLVDLVRAVRSPARDAGYAAELA